MADSSPRQELGTIARVIFLKFVLAKPRQIVQFDQVGGDLAAVYIVISGGSTSDATSKGESGPLDLLQTAEIVDGIMLGVTQEIFFPALKISWG